MKRKIYLFISCLFLSLVVFAQQPPKDVIVPNDFVPLKQDSSIKLKQDTAIKVETKVKKKRRPPNPKTSALLSLALPGLGQAYNRRWWKLPFVYAAVGGMVYLVDQNQTNYRRLRDALELKRNDEPHEFSGTSIDNVNSLRNLRDSYDKNTQLSYIGLVFVYLLQSIEAFVDAHLLNFDIEDDLSLRLKPTLESTSYNQALVGIGISLNIGKKKVEPPKDFLNLTSE